MLKNHRHSRHIRHCEARSAVAIQEPQKIQAYRRIYPVTWITTPACRQAGRVAPRDDHCCHCEARSAVAIQKTIKSDFRINRPTPDSYSRSISVLTSSIQT